MKKKLTLALSAMMLLTGCGNISHDSITPVSREDGSGTRGAFVELFDIQEKDENIIKNPILCHQTTMSNYDIDSTYKKLKLKFSNLKKIKMVCNATEKRQKMIIDLEKYNFLDKSLIIVVGDKTSNNSTKLYEMAKRLNKTDVIFIDNISELNFLNLKQYDEIHLFSGTSTPKSIVDELYNLLLDLDNINIEKLNSKLTLIEYVKN